MPRMNLDGVKSGRLSDYSPETVMGPAVKLAKLTKGVAFTDCPKAIWVGTPGTANIKDLSGAACANFPLFAGRNDIAISALEAGGTADDIWAMY